ncbi:MULTISPECIES: hypothetical protein [unclassified Sphingomonas]|uniref:hypothetical protein n=1 Tax=unclassified Sphingomonas TaxID=196159 RepID=UPI000AFCFC31|nr:MULTISPECIES: hypothetical protein [unclassified Sphingomonas]
MKPRSMSTVRLACFSLFAFQPAYAACPDLKPGALYPWQTSEIMTGDQWADVYLDIDERGRADNCRIGKNNVSVDMQAMMCRTLMREYTENPKAINTPAEQGTIKRHFFLAGRTHRKADEMARKQYFATHPDESQGCYP